MPELPEVETVKRVLEPQICGQRIVSVSVAQPQVIAAPTAEEFSRALAGQRITGMYRRGKFLLIDTEAFRVVLHLRMTGCLLVTPPDYEKAKHTHVIFRLEDNRELRFIDTRRFGKFWLLNREQEDTMTGIHRLGPEPFDEELTVEYLQAILSKKKKAIKECLLDQSIVAGIGNIYSDEILFRTGIHPSRSANSLTVEELTGLVGEIDSAMKFFIEKNVISAEDYLVGMGKDYRNTPYLQVYGHAGEPCRICGEVLVRQVIGGRSSVHCPRCQK